MKCLILAAGVGERLRPLTDKTPKPLIKVNDMAIIDYIISILGKHGIDKICVNLHHHPLQIIEHLGMYDSFYYN